MVQANMILLKNGSYAPPSKQQTVVFIDDLNMGKKSIDYDIQSPSEIFRDYSNFGGWYDQKQNQFYQFNCLTFIGAYSYLEDHYDSMKEGASFDWSLSFNERIFRHLFLLRMEALS